MDVQAKAAEIEAKRAELARRCVKELDAAARCASRAAGILRTLEWPGESTKASRISEAATDLGTALGRRIAEEPDEP